VPPQLLAVIFGVFLGMAFHLSEVGKNFLITLPEHAFHGFGLPDFGALVAKKELWYAAIIGVVTLTMIDGVESLATAMAIDRLDPYHRKSQPNRVLLAMGVCNIASSLVGGLTIIPGGVKSKANVASGGRTLWANFTNAICLIIYLLIAAPLIGLIPKGVLAAVLIYTGWKMCEPLVWKHMAHIGMEQLAIFTFTVLVTLVTDLLWGIAAGVAAKFVLNLVLYRQAIAATGADEPRPSLIQSALEMFRDPIGRRELRNGRLHVYLDKPLVCFNTMRLSQELGQLPAEAQALTIHLNAQTVGLIDHTSCENLMDVVRDYSDSEIPVEVVGLDDMKPLSDYHACTRVALAVVPAT
jgi:carbonic anhydrase